MNHSTPLGKAARSRATQRLRDLTIGTTLAGLAASAGFGWLAAATFDGNALKTATSVHQSTTTQDSAVGSPSTVGSRSAIGGTTDSAGVQLPSPTSMPSTSRVTRSSQRALVVTGGS